MPTETPRGCSGAGGRRCPVQTDQLELEVLALRFRFLVRWREYGVFTFTAQWVVSSNI